MVKILRNVFRFYEGEGTRVGVFFMLAAFLSAGIAITSSLGDALFLTRVGADSLPQLFIMMPVVMLVFIPVYSHLISRFGIDRIFNFTMIAHVFLATLICAGLFAFESAAADSKIWFYYLVKLNAYVWMVSLYSLFWNFVDTYFDILDAKRLFPFFSGGLAFGASLGGGLISLLGESVSIGWLFLLWGLLSLLVLPVLALIRRSWKKIAVEDSETPPSFVQETRLVLRTLGRSTYVSMVFIVLFMILFLTTMAEYSYLDVFSRSNTEAELAMLFGKLFFLVNIFNLLVNFFLFNRMVSLIGVRNVALVQPMAYLLVFAIFMINDGISAAYLAFFAYQGIMISIDANNWNFLFNAVPQQLKAQIRTFAEGLVDPLGTSIAGVFLLFVAPLFPLTRLAAFSFGFAVVLLLCVLFLRSRYKDAMVNVLKSNWLDFSRTHVEVASHISADEIGYIRERLDSGDIEIVAECLRLIYINERTEALDILLDLLERHRDTEIESKLKAVLFFFLKDEDIDVIRDVLDWLEKTGSVSSAVLEVLGAHGLIQSKNLMDELLSGNPDRREAAVVAMWNSWNLEENMLAIETMSSMLVGGVYDRIAAIRAIGLSNQEKFAHYLVSYLDAPEAEVRQESLLSIARLVGNGSSRIVPALMPLLEHGSQQERLTVLDVVARIGDSATIAPVLDLAENFSPAERRRVEQLVVNMGLRSVPAIVEVLNGENNSYPSRSIAARALGKLAFPQFEAQSVAIIRRELLRASDYMYFSWQLGESDLNGRGAAVLRRYYEDAYRSVLDFVLELLTIGGRLPNFELIGSSLRSGNQKARGNAIETLEQGVSRPVFKLLLPLVDSRGMDDRISWYLRNIGKRRTVQEIVSAAAASASDLESAIGMQALHEIDPEKAKDIARARIGRDAGSLFEHVALHLFDRHARECSLVERLYYIARSEFFTGFPLETMVPLIRAARLSTIESEDIFTAGQGSEALYVLCEGRVDVEGKSISAEGYVFGEKELFAGIPRQGTAHGKKALLMSIARQDLLDTISSIPGLGMAFLQKLAVI